MKTVILEVREPGDMMADFTQAWNTMPRLPHRLLSLSVPQAALATSPPTPSVGHHQ